VYFDRVTNSKHACIFAASGAAVDYTDLVRSIMPSQFIDLPIATVPVGSGHAANSLWAKQRRASRRRFFFSSKGFRRRPATTID